MITREIQPKQWAEFFDSLSRTVEPLTPHVPVPAGGYDRLLDWQPLGTEG